MTLSIKSCAVLCLMLKFGLVKVEFNSANSPAKLQTNFHLIIALFFSAQIKYSRVNPVFSSIFQHCQIKLKMLNARLLGSLTALNRFMPIFP
jgi:endonuclease III